MTDGELVRCVVAGETAAYGVLARRWFGRILIYCQTKLARGHEHEAEDMAQDVLVRGFVDLSSLKNHEHFGSWLRGIARHVCADWGRGRKHRHQSLDQLDEAVEFRTSTLPESKIAADEQALILDKIAALPEELREVILLHYYEHLTYDELANWLEVSRATVNERLAKGRALLRVRLAKLRSDV